MLDKSKRPTLLKRVGLSYSIHSRDLSLENVYIETKNKLMSLAKIPTQLPNRWLVNIPR